LLGLPSEASEALMLASPLMAGKRMNSDQKLLEC
jgi:hypothetical protein